MYSFLNNAKKRVEIEIKYNTKHFFIKNIDWYFEFFKF